MLHSEVVAEGSLASSLLSQAAPRNLHTCPRQHTACYSLHLNDPWGCLHPGCSVHIPEQHFPRSAWEAREEFSSGEAVKAFFALASDFIKWTSLHRIIATGNPVHFSTFEASRSWQGNTEGCTRLKPELKLKSAFFESLAHFSPFV